MRPAVDQRPTAVIAPRLAADHPADFYAPVPPPDALGAMVYSLLYDAEVIDPVPAAPYDQLAFYAPAPDAFYELLDQAPDAFYAPEVPAPVPAPVTAAVPAPMLAPAVAAPVPAPVPAAVPAPMPGLAVAVPSVVDDPLPISHLVHIRDMNFAKVCLYFNF